MRILISAVGTRGDVQPALALAQAVRALGPDVRLCLPPNFTGWAAELGFEARPMGVAMRPPPPGASPPPVPDLIADQFETVEAAADGRDLLVGCGAHQYALRSVAELWGLPCVQAVYAPVSLPAADLAPAGPDPGADEADITRLWAAHRQGWNDRSLARVNAGRARLGLPPIDDVLGHILGETPWLAADPALGPAPRTSGLSVFQPGAFLLPDETPLPEAVEVFHAAGDPPVYLGLGSMPAAPDAARTLIAAVRACGRRAILSRGWAGLEPIDGASDCLAVDDLNHQVLFGRVAAVVHHGGAGSTTAAALAGAPQVVTPMFSDQFYWGRRVAALGIGAAAQPGEALAAVLERALEPAVAARARGFAGRISRDGAAVAARRLVDASG